ncbi:hypothetical protein [Hymenobacter sp.]|jgi:hypothetical protein|uniref:hypothetical protein n=1 Tax=Hymenobacter sp. TaxID=1898978 RepID=UPI002EDA1020
MRKGGYFMYTVIRLAAMAGMTSSCNDLHNEIPSLAPPKNPGGVEIVADTKGGASSKKYQEKFDNVEIKSIYIDKGKLQAYINSMGENCKGFRLYRSFNQDNIIEPKGVIGVIIVGVDKNKNDITTSNNQGLLTAKAFASYDKCPDNCDKESLFYSTEADKD